jgi:WD40 repeat protein
VDRLLDDVGEEPGNLPLLEFTLTQLWEQQTDGWLTHANYEALGGVEGALSSYADQVYASLQTLEQARARRALVQLVQPGEGTEDTRRIATRQELGEESWILIQRLADRRLVVTGRDAAGRETAEVVHEALIQKWERFQIWMGADRAFRLWEERLRSIMRQWQESDQDEGALLRGAPLAEADAWAKERPQELSQLEAEYIQAGISLRERQQMERERRRQRTILALAAGLVLVAALGVIALLTGQRASRSARLALAEVNTRATAEALAVQERQNAQLASTLAVAQQVTAQANAQARATAQVEAEAQRAEADAQRHEARKQASIGLAAMALRELDTGRQDIGVLLALEALEKYPYTWQAEQALGQAVLQSRLRLFIQHEGPTTSVSWSPDGKRLLTASKDGTARVWAAASGEPLLRLDHKGPVKFASWSPDGSQILTSLAESETLMMWDGSSGDQLFKIEWDNGSQASFDARWSPDGDRLVISNENGTAWILDAHSGVKLHALSGQHEDYIDPKWSPTGDRLLTTSLDGYAVVWDAQSGEPIYTLRGHKESLTNVEWSPSGDRILTSSNDGTVKIWEAATGKARLTISGSTTDFVSGIWSPSGKRILFTTGQGAGSRVFDAATGEEQLAFSTGGNLRGFDWSPAGDRIAASIDDTSIIIWDATSGEELFTLRGQRGQYMGNGTAWSPDSQRLATGSTDGSVMVWDVRPVPTLVGYQSGGSAFWSPAGDRVLYVSDEGTRLWDASTLTELLAIENGPQYSALLYPSWSPSGDRFALQLGDGRVTIYDAATGAELLTITAQGLDGWAWPSWSPDGSLIAVGYSWDGSIRIWDAHSGAEVQLLCSYASDGGWDWENDRFISLRWSPSGDKIFSSTRTSDPLSTWSDSLKVWDATTGRLLFSTTSIDILRAAWSPDGKRIATFNMQAIGEIWDAETGENLLDFSGHTGWVNSLTWSPSGERIASGGVDGVVLVWDTRSGVEVLRYPIETVVGTLDWSPDGSQLLLSSEGKVVILPVWNTAQELIDYAHACCVARELSPEDRSLYGLPPAGSD